MKVGELQAGCELGKVVNNALSFVDTRTPSSSSRILHGTVCPARKTGHPASRAWALGWVFAWSKTERAFLRHVFGRLEYMSPLAISLACFRGVSSINATSTVTAVRNVRLFSMVMGPSTGTADALPAELVGLDDLTAQAAVVICLQAGSSPSPPRRAGTVSLGGIKRHERCTSTKSSPELRTMCMGVYESAPARTAHSSCIPSPCRLRPCVQSGAAEGAKVKISELPYRRRRFSRIDNLVTSARRRGT